MHRLIVAALVFALPPISAATAAPVKEGQAAPPFAVKTIAGRTLRLSGLRGKVVLLDFWGVPCPPCRIQMPVLQRWHERYKGRGLVVVGVEAMGSDARAIRKAMRERGVTYAVAPDPKNRVANLYGVEAHPTTILIDRAGRVVKIEVGYVRGDEKAMERALLPLLTPAKGTHP